MKEKTYEFMNLFDEAREMYPILVQYTYSTGEIGESIFRDMTEAVKFVGKIERLARKYDETITDIVILHR